MEKEIIEVEVPEWKFSRREDHGRASGISIRSVLDKIKANLDEKDARPIAPLGHGDPSVFPSFRTTHHSEDAIVSALTSARFNCYAPTAGIFEARCAVAEYLSGDLPYKLFHEDIFLTSGCAQAIEIVLSALSDHNHSANILLPRPGFPFYELCCVTSKIEARHFNLVPEREWEIDLDMAEALADENTVAMVLINPCNPCGNVLSSHHLSKIAETAKKLGIMIVADEVYAHVAFGKNPFVPMGAFGQTVPVLTLGSISKRWMVPGWRLGWIAATDPKGILKQTRVINSIKSHLNISTDPPTFIQGAIPEILKNANSDEFFYNTTEALRNSANLSYDKLKEIDCIDCPHKPEGSMFVMAKVNMSCLNDIQDDVEFCCRLAKEESVIILPAVGYRNWLRITFAMESSTLGDGLDRLKSFCRRHQKHAN